MRFSLADLHQIDREISQRSLSNFIKLAWKRLEVGIDFTAGWHIDAMCEHLEAMARSDITRLVINVPPGTMKSSTCCVFFPAWLWGPFGMPQARFIGAAYDRTLSTRDNRRTRLLIESRWFQNRWPTPITSDQNEKTFFENESRGIRQSSAVSAMTGKRGDFIGWDDPINPENANSPAHRATAIRVLTETLPSRFVDARKSGFFITMQRLHQDDPSGYVLANDLGYEHLCLPMEFEPGRRCRTKIGFVDPRTEEGELLAPGRFPRDVVDRDKKAMGAYATAGQFQQRPSPRGGGMFKRENFEIIPASPANCRWVRAWDLAASSEATSARTAGVRMGVTPGGEYVIDHVIKGQWTASDVEKNIANTAKQDHVTHLGIRGSVPQDPGAGGKAWARAIVKAAAGTNYHASTESGDKETRAEPFAAQTQIGNVKLVAGEWNKEYLDELELFPAGKFKDQVDASSRAFMELSNMPKFEWFVSGGEG